ncbi:hypothetical protein AAHA92_27036 [Salvia divinorum]|uniref:Agglutinin domain-containing protein n=1 Tax=Salvia divinorum TaxID=28513 RepID=A0ABD1G2E4_SALDI
MATKLTRFSVIKPIYYSNLCARREATGVVSVGEESYFSPQVKIEVEPSKVNNRYVHLRFCYNNRYWKGNITSNIVQADSTKPVEDTSSAECTLFEPIFAETILGIVSFSLTHVHTGFVVVVEKEGNVLITRTPKDNNNLLQFVNWDTLVKLPSHVAFKGYNGSYLGGIWAEGHQYLQFSVSDPNSEVAGHQVYLQPDGNLRIRSDHFSRYWQYQHDWIYASIPDPTGESNTLFWPVAVDGDTIALRCLANNRFCKSHDYDGKTRCLNAGADTIVNEARMTVQELVSNRKIYNVKYRMEDARIYGEKPYSAGTATATNTSDQEAQIGVQITYEDSKTYSFSRSTSLTAGVKATIEVGIPVIGKTSIEISFEVNTTFEWGNSDTTTTSVTATGSVPVPAKTVASVEYVATIGTCDVPYSYTQRDQSSTDGQITETVYDDGVFTGVNCYNFNFVIKNVKSLD